MQARGKKTTFPEEGKLKRQTPNTATNCFRLGKRTFGVSTGKRMRKNNNK
jgi:hypothetical protein